MKSSNLEAHCDYSPREPWPIGWESSFGPYNFCYLCGVVEAFWEKRVVVPDSIASELATLCVSDTATFNPDWLSVYPGRGASDTKINLKDWGLDQVGYGVLTRIAGYKPVAFPKAMLVLKAILNRSPSEDISVRPESLKIRLANSYVKSLDLALRELSAFDLEALYNQLGGRHVEPLVSDMRQGYPVTKQLSSHVIFLLKNIKGLSEEAKQSLDVCFYTDRNNLRAAVKSIQSSNGNGNTMRVARGEMPL